MHTDQRRDDEQPLGFSRFVRPDEGFQITDFTAQFFVSARGKDVASGLARRGDYLLAGFTPGDGQALLGLLDLDAVLTALIPIEALGPNREIRAAASDLTRRSRMLPPLNCGEHRFTDPAPLLPFDRQIANARIVAPSICRWYSQKLLLRKASRR